MSLRYWLLPKRIAKTIESLCSKIAKLSRCRSSMKAISSYSNPLPLSSQSTMTPLKLSSPIKLILHVAKSK